MEPDFETLLFLPLAHVFARLIAYMCMHDGVTVAFAESFLTVPQDLAAIRPQFIVSVPRLFEKARERVHARVEAAGGPKRKLFHWALEVGVAASRVRQQRRPLPTGLRWKLAVADRLALHKVRDGFGGRLIYAVSGAAPLNPSVTEFFDACGVTILEGIGMTENTSFSNVNRLQHNKIGTVGPPGPGIEVKIAEDGEVLTRGENTMKGYFKEPQATADTIDADGWLHTGDIGEIDDEGFLRITDRKKDLIITAGGKNIAPQHIERILRMSPYISHAMAHGDRRHFVTALVTLDPEAVGKWASPRGLPTDIEALAAHPDVQALIAAEVDERNRHLASFETVKRFHIVPRDFSIEGGELTPTMKIKRKVVTEMYRKELDALYL
jgi:long-chain acyl-CoA synthetase